VSPRLQGTFLALWCLVACPARLLATELRIDHVGATSQGYLYVEYECVSPFEGIYLEALNSGLPTTLTYTIEVYRQRTGWWDRLEEAYEHEFRLFRDLLNNVYFVVTPEEALRFAQYDSLVAAISRFQRGSARGPQYFQRHLFEPDQSYYVVITMSISPLTVEDLNELDAWLRGTLRGRSDEAGGGISGLSRTMGGLLMSMSGFGEKRVKGRTPDFRPRDIPRSPSPPRPPPEPRLAAPDSGHVR